ncbi:MAG TPA: SLBB domain-containing protein [Terriglobales bacterium]|nr:SLBB domain-containing protein [Terriglobales bacterium]
MTTTTSRAEKEAEQMVSLSAENIIAILEKEPGLLLEVKKMLVRTAYAQGRILDPQDLTDEALYQEVVRDGNVRVLITQEIENREYIRVKPTREELAREEMMGGQRMRRGPQTAETEDEFWRRHDSGNQVLPKSDNQQQQQQEQPPSGPEPYDSRRAVQRAQSQPSNGDSTQYTGIDSFGSGGGGLGGGNSTGLPLDVLGMQSMSPDQLSSLSASRMSGENAMSPAAQLNTALSGGAGSSALGNSGLAASLLGQSLDQSGSSGNQFPEQTSYEMPRRPPRQLPSKLDQPVLAHHANPYADIPSLYDLYSQYSQRQPVLTRFGSDIFQNGLGNVDALPMDVPAGPDYVIGPGDGLSIDLWGGVSLRLRRVVDREGKIALPEVGDVQVAGRTLGDVQHTVQNVLRSQFREVQADVSLARLRTVRVYVVGDVEYPGAYDVSSLSTPLNALYEAGGPTSRGSLRIIKHMRGNQLIEKVDIYDLLLHGVRANMQRLEAGDTLLVPPIGREVTIEGMVRRPAIYELADEDDLAEVLELAGGVLPSGTLRHIDVERVEAHESRTMLALEVPETNNEQSVNKALEDFKIQDGDKIKISPIVAFADKTVYLDGHVFRPGKYAFRDGMRVSDLIKSYKDMLPEPYLQHAEVIRLKAPDYKPEVIAFNLGDALAGKEQDLSLQPFDTVRVFGRFDFEDSPVITVSGEVRDPGDHVTNGATYLRDAIFLAGSTTPKARLDDVQVFRSAEDGQLKVLSVNLNKALAGDPAENILLEPKDRVFVHKNLSKTDPAVVTIEGEVARPGKYPLGESMNASDLVRLSGGLKRSAYTEEADLTRYTVDHGEKIVGDHEKIPIARALAGEPDTDVRLHDGDVLTIRQLTGWNDLGAVIAVQGEVVHPGTYGIQEGERLSSVLARAGGFRKDAYPYGAIFQRVQVRQLEEINRVQLVRQVKEEGAGLKDAGDLDPTTREAAMLQWKNTLDKLETTPPPGRMVIHVPLNTTHWVNTAADIQVRAGDVIYIPKRPNLVMIDGAVYNPTAVTFRPGRSASWYLKQAGGPTAMANKRAIFVIRADGSVAGGSGGLFSGGVLQASLQPGDTVVVPDRAFGGPINWKNTLQVAQLVSAVGIAVSVARSF